MVQRQHESPDADEGDDGAAEADDRHRQADDRDRAQRALMFCRRLSRGTVEILCIRG